MARCSYCVEDKNIVYRDWLPAHEVSNKRAVSIAVCFPCLKDLGIGSKMILTNTRPCGNCREVFLPKFSAQTRCGQCFKAQMRRKGK